MDVDLTAAARRAEAGAAREWLAEQRMFVSSTVADTASERELWTGIGALALVALRHGPLGTAMLGAVAASVPDAAHVLRLPRPGGRKLFPCHRLIGWHRACGMPAGPELVAAALLLGFALAHRQPSRRGKRARI